MSPQLADPNRSRIVLIGTAFHTHAGERLPDVPQVVNNLEDLANVFTDPELGGFDDKHCVKVKDGASLDQIGEYLSDAARNAEDLLMIYYAGHGLLDRRGQLHLALTATHPDRLGFSALPYETLRGVCLDSNARCRLVILDSCFSGRAVPKTLAESEQQVLGQLEVEGIYILTSAPANQTAVIVPGENHTAFTGRLLALLRNGSPDAGPVLGIGEIYRNLRRQLRADQLPEPRQCGTVTADQLGLVRNRQPGPAVLTDLYEPANQTLLGLQIARRAEQVAATITDHRKRAEALARIAEVVAATDPARARAIIDEAERIAKTDTSPRNRAHTLARVAKSVAATDSGRAERMIAAAENIAGAKISLWQPVDDVAWVAEALAVTDPDGAERIANTFADPNCRLRVLGGVAEVVAGADPARAERIANTIVNPWDRVRVLGGVAEVVAGADPARAERIARTAILHNARSWHTRRRAVVGPYYQAMMLARVAVAISVADRIRGRRLSAEIERIAKKVINPGDNELILACVAVAAAVDDPTRAREIIAAEAGRRTGIHRNYTKLASSPSGSEEGSEWFSLDDLDTERWPLTTRAIKAWILVRFVEVVALTDYTLAKVAVFDATTDPTNRGRLWAKISNMVGPIDPLGAEKIAEAIADPFWKVSALAGIARSNLS